jgi:hypothetical protein
MDPATIKLILAALEEFLEGYNDAVWKDKVSKKLDEISLKLDIVIAQLTELKVWVLVIHDEIINLAPRAFKNEVEAARRQIEADGPAVLTGRASKNQIDGVIAARNSIAVAFGALYDWKNYGFTYYYAVISGVVTHVYASAALRITSDSIEKICEDACTLYLVPAIDPDNNKSLEFAKRQQLAAASAADIAITSDLNRWWLTNFDRGTSDVRDENGSRPGIPARWRAVRITGDVRVGFSYEQSEGEQRGGRAPNFEWYPGIRHFNMGDGDAGLNAVKALVAQTTAAYTNAVEAANQLQQHVAAVQEAINSLSSIAVTEVRKHQIARPPAQA